MIVLDSGAVSRLAEASRYSAALIRELISEGLWPPVVPSAVLVECLTGRPGDARTNRLLKTCEIAEQLSEPLTRRAALLRARAAQGSAVDAIVVAAAEPRGTVLTTDRADIQALAGQSDGVLVAVL